MYNTLKSSSILTVSLLMLSVFFANCKKEEEAVYNLPIPQDKLVDIMIDLTLAEAATANYKVKYRDSIKNLYRFQIETIYDINMSKVDSTLQMLYKNPPLNKNIQSIVLDSIKVMEQKVKRNR